MPVICWAPLAKSAQDPTTISEYIAGKILDHNVNPSAHGLDGYVVHNHRVSTLLDHPDGSVDLRKLVSQQHILWTVFESLDGWSKTPTGVDVKIFGTILQTGGIINIKKELIAEPLGDSEILNPVKNPFFQTSVRISTNTNQIVYFMTDSFNDDDSDSGFGFKVENGTLYALVTKPVAMVRTEYKTEITGITITDWNIYRAFYDYANEKIEYYVNGILKHTETTNLPTAANPVFFTYYIKNLIAENKAIYIKYLLWSRDL